MRKYAIHFIVICLVSLSCSAVTKLGVDQIASDITNFHAWKQACDTLPSYKVHARNPHKTILNTKLMNAEIDRFFATMKRQISNMPWLNRATPVKIPSDAFQAYVEKLVLPNNAVVAIHGDFHGDINAFNRFLKTFADRGYLDTSDPFKIKADNFYILFLGDYVDRGWYGTEVMYAILRLKNENPDRVFFTRGNHEDLDLNNHYGFAEELKRKFSTAIIKKIQALYNALPLALYIGAQDQDATYNYIQCCHGGIEVGYNPRSLLEHSDDHVCERIERVMQKDLFAVLDPLGVHPLKSYFNNKQIDTGNGFMWTDFFAHPDMFLSLSPRDGYTGSLFQYGKRETRTLLQKWSSSTYKIRSIFRAHQHSDKEMCDRFFNHDQLGHADDRGVAKLWIEDDGHKLCPALLDNVAVVTFSVAPEAGYGWPFHSFGELHIKPAYTDWRLYAYQLGI